MLIPHGITHTHTHTHTGARSPSQRLSSEYSSAVWVIIFLLLLPTKATVIIIFIITIVPGTSLTDRTSQRAHSCAHKHICLGLPARPESCPGTSGLRLVLRNECPVTSSSSPGSNLASMSIHPPPPFLPGLLATAPSPKRKPCFTFVQDSIFPGAQISPGLADNADLIARRWQRNQPMASRCHLF